MAEFKLTERKLTTDGKYVLRTGRIFRAGEYKDKDFVMTPEELIEAEANFTPVPIDIEHHDNLSFLTGKLGTLESVVASEDGEELFGTVKLPIWLDDLNDKNVLPVSCTWGKEDKLLKKLAITDTPRVSDAALFAAFTANEIEESPEKTSESVKTFFNWIVENGKEAEFKENTWHGKSVMQDVHDSTARAGAICSKPPKDKKAKMAVETAKFVSKDESAAIQKMHDIATANGGKCYFMDSDMMAMYSKDGVTSSKSKGDKKMSFKKELINFFKGLPDDVDTVDEKETVEHSSNPEVEALKAQVAKLTATIEANSKKEEKKEEVVENSKKDEVNPEVEALKAQVAKLTKEAAEQEARVLDAEANTFAEEVIKDNKIKPESKAVAVELFKVLISDDKSNKVEVKFSDDKTVDSRVQLFKDFVASLASHNLTKEELVGMHAGVLSVKDKKAVDDTKKIEDDAKKQAAEFAAKFNKGRAKGAGSVETFSA